MLTTQRRLATLFVVTPLFFPFIITAVYLSYINVKLFKFSLSTQVEYSSLEETIQIRIGEKLAFQKIEPREWIFNMDGDQPRDSSPLSVLAKAPGAAMERVLRRQDPGIQVANTMTQTVNLEEDPFLEEWKQKNQKKPEKIIGYVALNKSVPLPSSSSKISYIIDDGRNRSASTLNINFAEDRYLNYETLEGRIEWPDLSPDQYFSEVSFYDQMGPQGLDDDSSTALASQEMRDENHSFSLRVPIESRGFLIAKIYSIQDTQKENPLYIGAYGKNPIVITKNGIPGLLLSLVSKTKYLEKYETVFEGKLVNEYNNNEGEETFMGAHVWVAETGQHVVSDEKGVFEIKGLLQAESYQLIFEKEGFMTTQIPITMDQKRKTQTFLMAPLSKFTNGYDVLLGGRDASKSIVFATLLKKGMPLSRAIVKAPQTQKILYERTTDLISLPDSTLFSSTENGKVLLWNVTPGKNKIDIYQNGEWVASRVVKLSPGVAHYLALEF
ncbi:MAG: hypothetical protein A2Z91_04680 [Deltaproteobacteria bacterium GWA2_38_16]|nr:MAG: hypothetical protein A2Z91_04680 [Deltaproteobacteria bacterium GWA2_38_16]OGQ34837.1 MAG: hypothetical protein A3A72_05475 [Deltaproteobacteria bacterium RIFCSPLOWO2_01_FULL_38_9]